APSARRGTPLLAPPPACSGRLGRGTARAVTPPDPPLPAEGGVALHRGPSGDRPVPTKNAPASRGVLSSKRALRSALVERHVVAHVGAGVDLARTADARAGRLVLLDPVRDPAGGTGDGEHHGEHL